LHIIDFNKSGRKDAKDKVVKFAKEYNIKFKTFDYEIKEDEFYLVFGSFAVVEQFLKVFNAR
jgi:folylpolyglutamate synthase/dihydropteroate synthase